MQKYRHGITGLALILLVVLSGIPAVPQTAAAETPHLELVVEPASVPVGERVTLQIGYVGVGLVHTTITISPTGSLVFDPPLEMPCRYDEHPNGCTSITLRARQVGTVTINATASGEIYNPGCTCFHFTLVTSSNPAQFSIRPATLFFPFLRQ